MKKRLPRDELYGTMKVTEEDLNSDGVKEVIMALKRKKTEECHELKIWYASDGRWKTYYSLPDGKRKLLAYKCKDDLIEKLMELNQLEQEDPTIQSIFEDWLEEKLSFNEISLVSAGRYKCDFDRFFVKYDWNNIRIKDVDMQKLTDFVKQTIANEKLTKKTFGNFRIVIRGIFMQAKKRGFVNFNIKTLIEDMFISKRSFTVVKKEMKSEILDDDEVKKMTTYLSEHKDPMNMAILLDFYTGLRIGELCALKKSDWIEECYLHIQRTETYVRNQCQESDETSTTISDSTKTESGDRLVYLCPEAVEILQWLIDYPDNDTEWLFVSQNQKRIVRATLHRRLTKVCNEVGIPHRSMHKIRKTYASRLLDSGVNENIIIKQLGHTNINITKDYYYFMHQMKDEQARQLSQAVKDYDKKVIKSNQTLISPFVLVDDEFKQNHRIG